MVAGAPLRRIGDQDDLPGFVLGSTQCLKEKTEPAAV
jgi:hypothetical protein